MFCFRKVLSVDKLIIHKDFDQGRKFSNDIALMKLTEKLDLGVYMPACLIPRDSELVNINMTGSVYGWGRTGHIPHSPLSNILRFTSLTISPNNKCESLLNPLNENMICGLNDGSTFCNGDSGGPMTVENEGGRHYLAGIVSFGELVKDAPCPIQVSDGSVLEFELAP